MREQVEIARRLWTGSSVEQHTDRYEFSDVDLKPTPVSAVPVWWGGATPASARLAVDFCDGWLPGRITFPTYERRLEQIRERCAEQGRPLIMTGAVPVTSVAATREEALRQLNVPGLIKNANNQRFWLKPPSGEFTRIEELDGSILAGTVEDVAEGVSRYEEIGCDLLVFDLRFRFADWLDQISAPRGRGAPAGHVGGHRRSAGRSGRVADSRAGPSQTSAAQAADRTATGGRRRGEDRVRSDARAVRAIGVAGVVRDGRAGGISTPASRSASISTRGRHSRDRARSRGHSWGRWGNGQRSRSGRRSPALGFAITPW